MVKADADSVNLAWNLVEVEDKIKELKAQVDKLDTDKENLVARILEKLGNKADKDNFFNFPDKKKILNIKRYDMKQFDKDVESEIRVAKQEMEGIKEKAINKGKYILKASYRVHVTDMKF